MSEIKGVANFKFHEGKLEEFKRLSGRCMEIVRAKDTGTLQYELFFNEDQTECMVFERYRDADALIEHIGNIGDELMGAIMATGDVSGFVLGAINTELRKALMAGGVKIYTPFTSL